MKTEKFKCRKNFQMCAQYLQVLMAIHVHILLHHTEAIEIIQRDTDPKHESSTSENPSTAAAPKVPPVRPPHKYLPFYPACKLS